jgi:NAD(P)-dependent dehydrogenase (short-subunit alcohol dehydrogenase family)
MSSDRKITLAGRSAVVTGAGRGIGRATAIELARLGASVVVNDIGTELDGTGADTSLAEKVVAEIVASGGRAAASTDSVTDFVAAERIIGTAIDRFGSVDVLVNNAGLSAGRPIWELDPELFDRVSASHIKGTYNCTRLAVPHMKERGWGRIVNLVSRAGIIGVPGAAAYGAGKGGVFGFTNVVARDLAPFGITVNAVNPSSTETRMVMKAVEEGRKQGGEIARRSENLLKTVQQPEDVASFIGALCSDEAGGVTGQVFFVAKSQIGLFQPLTLNQTVTRDDTWTADELLEAIRGFKLHPLDVPYA